MSSSFLYHGSMFHTGDKPLVPGIVHTGKEVTWDGGLESNHYLYTTGDAHNAILLGIGSMTEKTIGTQGFKYGEGDEIFFIFEKEDLITEKELEKKLKNTSVYLYTIQMKRHHNWIKNNNPKNNIEEEYKTRNAIPRSDFLIATIDVLKWLKDKELKWVTMTK